MAVYSHAEVKDRGSSSSFDPFYSHLFNKASPHGQNSQGILLLEDLKKKKKKDRQHAQGKQNILVTLGKGHSTTLPSPPPLLLLLLPLLT